jgi:hypothetical protein
MLEPRGRRPKLWVRDPDGKLWLRKQPPPPDPGSAQERGFQLLPEFPAHRPAANPYFEPYLFPLFAERIPTPTRRDAADMLASWGVEHPDDQIEVLARSGGLRATDRLETAEYRAPDDDLSEPLEFRIAGRSRIADAAPLSVGDVVSLRREPDNVADQAAVIVDRLGRRAGYVPRQYTQLLGGLLDGGVALHARVIESSSSQKTQVRWWSRSRQRGPSASSRDAATTGRAKRPPSGRMTAWSLDDTDDLIEDEVAATLQRSRPILRSRPAPEAMPVSERRGCCSERTAGSAYRASAVARPHRPRSHHR